MRSCVDLAISLRVYVCTYAVCMHFLARFSTDSPRFFVQSHPENDRCKLHSSSDFISHSFTQNSKFDHVWSALATSLYNPAAVLAELSTSLFPHPPPSPLHLGLPAMNCQTTRSRALTSFCRYRHLGLGMRISRWTRFTDGARCPRGRR
jgi:hypothetical protein